MDTSKSGGTRTAGTTTGPEAVARDAYRKPTLRYHGRLIDLVQQGNLDPAPDLLTGQSPVGT